MENQKALFIVDFQKDFCSGGALEVKDADEMVPQINSYIDLFAKRNLPVLASRDWHHPRTKHFKEFGGKWPPHCVMNTEGAEFHPDLKLPDQTIIISEGMSPEQEAYSAFEGIDDKNRTLEEVLKGYDINELFVCGLATDYCVKTTVLDALNRGFRVVLLKDAIKGVDLQPGDSERAVREMKDRGAEIAVYTSVVEEVSAYEEVY